MWLRDFLPQYVPTARILTYGYDSTLLGNDSTSSISDFAGRLLETLKTARAHKHVSTPEERDWSWILSAFRSEIGQSYSSAIVSVD